VVTASRDKSARVWDAADGKPLTAPLQHRSTVIGAFWSTDGKRLNTVTEDDYLQVWDLASGEPLTPPRRIQELADPSVRPSVSARVQANADLPRDNRPVADLVLLSQMLALGRIDPDGSVVPLQLPELTSAWHFLRDKYPEQFSATPAEVAEWQQENDRARIYDQLKQAIALANDGKPVEAEKLFTRLLAETNSSADQKVQFLTYRADIRARSGRWEEAATDLARAVENNPTNHLLWHSLAPLLVQNSQLEAYREHCRKSLERFGKTTDPFTADRIAKDCLILPGSGVNLDTVATMADTAVAEGQHSEFFQFFHYFQFCKGLAEYRQGRFASAADWMGTVLTNRGEALDLQTEAYMVLAMSRSQSHQVEQARAALAKGTELEQELPKLGSGDVGASWVDWIIAHALMREAKAIIGAQPPAAEQSARARLQ
jgi:tetratricopeptide (TPR) repeat protein